LEFLPFARLDQALPCDFHMHTNITDGTASVLEMAEAAQSARMTQILFSEHIRQTSTYFPEFSALVRRTSITDVQLFVGVEAKVLDTSGALDMPAGTAEQCDAIIGSVHRPPGHETSAATWSRMEVNTARALEFALARAIVLYSPAHILGHPLGMCVTKFRIEPLDELYALARLCASEGKAFELNPRYCGDIGTWLDIVSQCGCPVSIGSDAHRVEDVGRAWREFVGPRSGT
jgi:putative hydrolase